MEIIFYGLMIVVIFFFIFKIKKIKKIKKNNRPPDDIYPLY